MNKNKYYAGVGSRETPQNVLAIMTEIGTKLAELGYILRSGGADGADEAFEVGCDSVGGKKEIFLPWKGFNHRSSALVTVSVGAMKIAKDIHGAWDKCNEWVQLLHGRNVYQVLGQTLKNHSDFVVCWTEKGKTTGGTATAIKIAEKYNIAVYNLGSNKGIKAFCDNVFPIELNENDSYEYKF